MENTSLIKSETADLPINESFSKLSFTEGKKTPMGRFSILENSSSSKYIADDYLSNNKKSFVNEKSKEIEEDTIYKSVLKTSHKKYESVDMSRKSINKSYNMNLNDSSNYGSSLDKSRDIINNLTVDDLNLKINQERRRLIDNEIDKRIKRDAESRLKLEKKLKNQIIAKLTASTSKSASKYNHSPSINLILYFLNFYKDWK